MKKSAAPLHGASSPRHSPGGIPPRGLEANIADFAIAGYEYHHPPHEHICPRWDKRTVSYPSHLPRWVARPASGTPPVVSAAMGTVFCAADTAAQLAPAVQTSVVCPRSCGQGGAANRRRMWRVYFEMAVKQCLDRPRDRLGPRTEVQMRAKMPRTTEVLAQLHTVGPEGKGLACTLSTHRKRRSRRRMRADNFSIRMLQQTAAMAATEPWHAYRLGDMYMRDTPPDLDYHLLRWPTSLAAQYAACRTRNQDAATLDLLLAQTCRPEFTAPETIAVHLRLGDQLCYFLPGGKKQLLHAISQHDASLRRPPTWKAIAAAGQRLRQEWNGSSTLPRARVQILFGDHSGRCGRASRRFADQAAAILHAQVLDLASPDEHLCRMVGAGLFVQGRGGYTAGSPRSSGGGVADLSGLTCAHQRRAELPATPFAATHKIVGSLQFISKSPRGPTLRFYEKRTKGVVAGRRFPSCWFFGAARFPSAFLFFFPRKEFQNKKKSLSARATAVNALDRPP